MKGSSPNGNVVFFFISFFSLEMIMIISSRLYELLSYELRSRYEPKSSAA